MNREDLERELVAAENTLKHFNIIVERRKLPEQPAPERPRLQLIQGGKK